MKKEITIKHTQTWVSVISCSKDKNQSPCLAKGVEALDLAQAYNPENRQFSFGKLVKTKGGGKRPTETMTGYWTLQRLLSCPIWGGGGLLPYLPSIVAIETKIAETILLQQRTKKHSKEKTVSILCLYFGRGKKYYSYFKNSYPAPVDWCCNPGEGKTRINKKNALCNHTGEGKGKEATGCLMVTRKTLEPSPLERKNKEVEKKPILCKSCAMLLHNSLLFLLLN